jgi:rubrerythrin
MYYSMTPGWSRVEVSNTLLNLITEAMRDERHDRKKYETMMEMTSDAKIKEQIEFAYEDEEKHYNMFKQIYFYLTGKQLEVQTPNVEKYDNLKAAVESSINGELEAVELYRKIQSMLPTQQLRDMLFEIITDEQEHAIRFVYLFSLIN